MKMTWNALILIKAGWKLLSKAWCLIKQNVEMLPIPYFPWLFHFKFDETRVLEKGILHVHGTLHEGTLRSLVNDHWLNADE